MNVTAEGDIVGERKCACGGMGDWSSVEIPLSPQVSSPDKIFDFSPRHDSILFINTNNYWNGHNRPGTYFTIQIMVTVTPGNRRFCACATEAAKTGSTCASLTIPVKAKETATVSYISQNFAGSIDAIIMHRPLCIFGAAPVEINASQG
jgi:hypothetical protein